jgi:hypothetical protein
MVFSYVTITGNNIGGFLAERGGAVQIFSGLIELVLGSNVTKKTKKRGIFDHSGVALRVSHSAGPACNCSTDFGMAVSRVPRAAGFA